MAILMKTTRKYLNQVIHSGYLDNTFEISFALKNDSSFNCLSALTKSKEFTNSHKRKLLTSLDNFDTSQWEDILKLEEAVKFLHSIKRKISTITFFRKVLGGFAISRLKFTLWKGEYSGRLYSLLGQYN